MSDLRWVIWLIPALPLLGFLVTVLLARSERAAGLIASVAVGLSFVATIASIAVMQSLPEEARRLNIVLWEWISVGAFRVSFGVLFDQLTAVMALLITGVGGLIHIYSIGYMHGDSRPVRFFAYLNLFIFAMLMLVMADNLLLLFLGWEGVGLCSFLLIGHYFDRRSVAPGIVPSEAAVKAFVVNRVGDAAFLLAIILVFSRLGSISFFPNEALGINGYLERAPELAFTQVGIGFLGSIGVITAICLLMLIGVTGKSAQVPLYTWLPDAMAGPTPVSALIHAATMVTAGVYLIVRNHTLFSASPTAAGVVVAIGLVTAFLAATAAITQFDIKRVLAYSTISQLGYMVTAVGMGAYAAGMFHLLTHGFFKALLFLAAGAIIHAVHETQDMRRMGGLKDELPTTFRIYAIGALALAGIFPFAGFWSKDEIIAHAWFTVQNPGAAVALIVTSMLTAFYMGRQVALIFYGKRREPGTPAHEPGNAMRIPLFILAAAAVLGGLINLPGVHWLSSFLEPVIHEPEVVYTLGMGILATIATLLSIGGAYLGWWLYARALAGRVRPGRDDPALRYLGDLWRGAELGWGFDWFYQRVIVRPYRNFSQTL
ncbi:MAG TPA: NADH-quinone oxidoreductase subunit L, partial [Roseiflexaceae bacterium]|nr:NADH-quinone oxidoreductase subunit L [Roseiflexaceae bacterium]